jgi:hypothetical protein
MKLLVCVEGTSSASQHEQLPFPTVSPFGQFQWTLISSVVDECFMIVFWIGQQWAWSVNR